MMKKFLSVLLAGTLLLSTTAFATDWSDDPTLPQSRVYFTENFEKYDSVSSFSEYATGLSTSAIGPSGSEVLAQFKLAEAAEKVFNVQSKFNAAKAAFETNAAGKKSLRTLTKANTGSSGSVGALLYIPSESWNYLDNQNDIYIISYDIDVNPKSDSSDRHNYQESFSYWADEELENSTNVMLAWSTVAKNSKDVVSYKYCYGREHGSFSHGLSINANKTERLAMAYTYDDAAVKDHDSTGEEYGVPMRYFSRNGVAPASKYYKSTEPYGKDANAGRWKNKPVLTGFSLGWNNYGGYEYADIKAYTINKEPNSFGVSIVDSTVELGQAAVVKFSHPVYHGSVTKDALSIVDDDTDAEFTTFEIGEIKDVVNTMTKEVYTTAEILFPYGIKAEGTYTITFNNAADAEKAVVNEIAFKLGENNSVTFETMAKPINLTTVSKSESLTAGLNNFSAKVTEVENDRNSFLFIGVYDENGELVSYTYTSAKLDDEISLSAKLGDNYSVKAFCSGSVYDLSQCFGTPAELQTASN